MLVHLNQSVSGLIKRGAYLVRASQGMVNGPLKNDKSRQILLKSWNLAQPSNGSRNLRFCVCRSHICFSIKSIDFVRLGLRF